jgi:hypothetical protein
LGFAAKVPFDCRQFSGGEDDGFWGEKQRKECNAVAPAAGMVCSAPRANRCVWERQAERERERERESLGKCHPSSFACVVTHGRLLEIDWLKSDFKIVAVTASS